MTNPSPSRPRAPGRCRQDEAPELPLKTQDADELADRPKSTAFAELGLNDQITADLAAIDYQEPTPIQAGVIRAAVAGAPDRPGPDRHRQDRRLHPADAAPPVRVGRPRARSR